MNEEKTVETIEHPEVTVVIGTDTNTIRRGRGRYKSLTIRNIENPGSFERLKDEQVPGLYMRISKTKRNFYYLYWDKKTRRTRNISLGYWPMLDITTARELARRYFRAVTLGHDVRGVDTGGIISTPLHKLAETFLAWIRDHKKDEGKKDRYYIERFINPRIGNYDIARINHDDLRPFFYELKETPIQCNRVRATLSAMFTFAEQKGWRLQGSNPLKYIKIHRERKIVRCLSKEETLRIQEALKRYENQYPRQAAFLWLLIYTGARPGEIGKARRGDRKGNILELTDHKTDYSGNNRIIYLPDAVVKMLEALPPTKDGSLLGIKYPRHLWEKILDELGITDLRIYDLRHNFASAGLMAGLSLPQIGELLGHKNPATTKRYTHLMVDGAKEKANIVAGYLDRLLGSSTPPPLPSDVVQDPAA